MENGRKANMNRRQQRLAASFAARSKPWSSNATRPEPKGSHNAQRNYERYLELARAEALTGNTVGAECPPPMIRQSSIGSPPSDICREHSHRTSRSWV
jgi:hypothetical protein